MSKLLDFMMCASSVSLLCIPFMLICKILRSCLLCCADCDCWWLVAGLIWGVLGVGVLVAGTICGVVGVGRLVADALVGSVVWGVLGMDGLVAGSP